MSYSVKEIFYTLQGEGLQAGMPAVFCRFAGCNLWSGRETDRSAAICQFCDTDFVGTNGSLGAKYQDATSLVETIENLWPVSDRQHRLVVLTGGEPLLQVDESLIAEFHARHFRIAIETNGTLAAPQGIDWICVSPKAGAPWIQKSGNELKLVYPQPTLMPDDLAIEALQFDHFLLQPMDGPLQAQNTRAAIDYCQANPRWRLSVQTHKITGIR